MPIYLNAAGEGGMSILIMYAIMAVLLIGMFVIPQRRQNKRDAEMRSSLEIGDEVTTVGGIVGRVVALKDDTFVLETGSERVRIRFRKSALASVEKLDMGSDKK